MDTWKKWTKGEKWDQLQNDVATKLSSLRFEHTKRVVETAKALAKHYKQPVDKAMLAALFHDYAKELSKEQMLQVLMNKGRNDIIELAPSIWHASVGAYMIEEVYPFGEDIYDAIYYHTTGRKEMSELEKIIFLADYIEPKRTFAGVDYVRKMTWKNLDEAMYLALNLNIEKLLKKHFLIAEITVEARNYFLTRRSVTYNL